MTDRFLCQPPDPSRSGPRIETHKDEAMKAALLEVIPADPHGAPFASLRGAVRDHLPPHWEGSVGWYLTTVKLDLEARGLIERVPKSRPQRVRAAM